MSKRTLRARGDRHEAGRADPDAADVAVEISVRPTRRLGKSQERSDAIAALGWRDVHALRGRHAWTRSCRNFADAALALLRLHALQKRPGGQDWLVRDRQRLLREMERQGGWRLMLHGQLDLVREATAGLDGADLTGYPRLRMGRILVMCKDDRLPLAERDWAAFLREYVRGPIRRVPRWEIGVLRELVAGYAGIPPTQMRLDDLHRLALEVPQSDPESRAVIANLQLHAAVEIGDFAGAQRHAKAGLAGFRQARSAYGEVFIHIQRGLAECRAGHMAAAERDFVRAADLARAGFESDSELIALPGALRAVIAYERNDLGEAARMLERDLPAIENSEGWTEPLWLLYRAAIGLCARQAAPQAPYVVLRRARDLAQRRGLRRLDALLGLKEIELALHNGQDAQATKLATRLRIGELAARNLALDPSWREARLRARIVQTQLALRARAALAESQTVAMLREARASGMPELVCAALVMELERRIGCASAETLRTPAAELLDQLAPERCWRSVLDMPGFADLWTRLPAAARQGWSTKQRATARHMDSEVRMERRLRVADGHAVAFTATELRILAALGEGLRNKEIARQLSRSENTVKFYLKRLSGKLETRGRRQLAQRAREIGVC